ncbi:hypothetical protein [Sporosarcina sp. NPDC096371]|uniref:hypothetical protein n=1 Tax=Sporosarcina sp. NPDC096371 TaxID=3364530 RepID=UPI0037FE8004
MILVVLGLKKYHLRTIIIVAIAYTFIPMFLITAYQETFARGISAISYDGNGSCLFMRAGKDLLSGDCTLTLHNRSNNAVSFEVEFLDSFFMGEGLQMESLMNLAGPYKITIEANRKKTIQLNELLDVSNIPKHIKEGGSSYIHFKLSDGETERIL